MSVEATSLGLPISDGLLFTLWLGGMLLTWPAALWYARHSRARRGEPWIPRKPADARFVQSWASGYGGGVPVGGASNCLLVAITPDELWVTPQFPFNLFIPYGWLGLDHRVRASGIVEAGVTRGLLTREVRLLLQDGKGGRRKLNLLLRSPEAFLEAVRRL